MQSLSEIFADAFAIWSRNYALMYVLFFFLLLGFLAWPEGGHPEWNAKWVTLGVLLVLLQAAFNAGWYHMVAAACQQYFTSQKNKPVDLTVTIEAAKLFGEFFPGLGQYFPAFVVGMLIKLLLLVLLYLAMQDTIQENWPILDRLFQLPVGQQEAALENLKAAEKMQLTGMMFSLMGAGVVYAIYFVLTMFWPAFVTLYKENVLTAFARSIRQFFRDPLRIGGISLLFFLFQVFLMIFMTLGVGPFLVGQFLTLTLGIFTAILLYVYLIAVIGEPADFATQALERSKAEHDDARDNF